MNRTKIEWCDFTWNPVTGCWGPGGTKERPNRCWYCYAKNLAERFNPKQHPYEPINGDYGSKDNFAPVIFSTRMFDPEDRKKPARIFVCSMGDLFGDWVPTDWIDRVRIAIKSAPWHTFIFLTKNPKRYQEFNPWPVNCWLGATVTNQADADERVPELLQAQTAVRFVSVEPMLGAINISLWDKCDQCGRLRNSFDPLKDMKHPWVSEFCHNHYNPFGGCDGSYHEHSISWLIIGAMTGLGSKAHQPKTEWVQNLIEQGRAAGIPVFLKDNLHWPEKIQNLPNSHE